MKTGPEAVGGLGGDGVDPCERGVRELAGRPRGLRVRRQRPHVARGPSPASLERRIDKPLTIVAMGIDFRQVASEPQNRRLRLAGWSSPASVDTLSTETGEVQSELKTSITKRRARQQAHATTKNASATATPRHPENGIPQHGAIALAEYVLQRAQATNAAPHPISTRATPAAKRTSRVYPGHNDAIAMLLDSSEGGGRSAQALERSRHFGRRSTAIAICRVRWPTISSRRALDARHRLKERERWNIGGWGAPG